MVVFAKSNRLSGQGDRDSNVADEADEFREIGVRMALGARCGSVRDPSIHRCGRGGTNEATEARNSSDRGSRNHLDRFGVGKVELGAATCKPRTPATKSHN